MYSFVYSKSCNRLRVDKAEALLYIYTNSKLPRLRPGADLVRWYDNNILSEDSDLDDNGQETESEENDDGGNDGDGGDDDGMFGPLGGEIPGENEPGTEHAPNNNDNGQNLDEFDWHGFSDDDLVGGVYCRNCSPTPSSDGRNRDIQLLEDYDDVRSDRSNDNVENGNDDDRNDSVHNGNDEEAPNNVAVGGDAKVGLQGPQNNTPRRPEEVPVQHGLEINVLERLNENLVQEIAPQVEAPTDL